MERSCDLDARVAKGDLAQDLGLARCQSIRRAHPPAGVEAGFDADADIALAARGGADRGREVELDRLAGDERARAGVQQRLCPSALVLAREHDDLRLWRLSAEAADCVHS